MLHLSKRNDLKILIPSHPAEDIIDGEIIWDVEEKELFKKCVCFGLADVKDILIDIPLSFGYIYESSEPITEYREFYKEAEGKQELSQHSKEIRVYRDVPVKKIGEFKTIYNNGLDYRIKYY